MNLLGQRIAGLIAAQGPISVAQFMTLALHDPDYGVYAARNAIGRAGDFITAPEISQMFGELLGAWCVAVWHQLGKPQPLRLIELGPGRGTLMADALRAAKADREFSAQIEVVLVEASAPLKAAQQQVLAQSSFPLRWESHLSGALLDQPFLLLANEFFDALPLRQYVWKDERWHERMVTLVDDALTFAAAPAPAAGLSVPSARGAPEPGAVYEISPSAIALCEEIAHAVQRQGGAALIADYGYGQSGFGDTLQALSSHTPVPVLHDPGSADLSAHVDFTALSDATTRAGANPFGPVAQGDFLKALGIEARAAALIRANPAAADAVARALYRLTDDTAMGRLFKMFAIMPLASAPPPGF